MGTRLVNQVLKPFSLHLGTNEFQQLSELGVTNDLQQEMSHRAGALYPSFAATLSQRGVIGASTPQLKTFFDAIGFAGLAITGAAPAVARWEETTLHGGPSGNGEKATITSGMAIGTQVEASQGQIASATMEVIGDFDGSLDPLQLAAELPLTQPATKVADEHFTVGPWKFNAAFIGGIQRVSIPFNVTLDEEAAAGDIWNSFTAAQIVQPRIELDVKPWVLRSYGFKGTIQSGTTEGWFRAKRRNEPEPDGSGVHVKITVAQSTIRVGQIRGPFPGTVTTGLIIQPEDDGTDFLTVNTAAVIA